MIMIGYYELMVEDAILRREFNFTPCERSVFSTFMNLSATTRSMECS